MQARTEQPVEQEVAAVEIGFAGVAAAAQDQLAVEPEPGAGGGGLPRMVGLQRPDRQHRVGALRQCFAEEEFQLA